jgi:excisionase family DNA binding protein
MSATTESPPLAYGVNDATKAAGDVSRSFLYEAMTRGELPYVKVGSRRLILRSDLEAWLLAHRRGGDDRAA